MAFPTGALTLPQYAILSNDPLVQAVTFSLLDNGSVLTDIPFQNKQVMIANGVRWEGNLPTVNWVPMNTEGVATSGTPKPYAEQVYMIRNNIDTDKVMVQDQTQISDVRGVMADAYMRSVAYDFNLKFINNNHATGDKNAIVGLRARLDNPTAYGVRSGNKINASGVDLSQSGISVASANAFLEWLDQLLWSVDSPDGQDVILYMNEVMKRRFAFALRTLGTSGGLTTTKDQFDRTVEMYKGAVVRDIGYQADQSTRIIATTETNAGADGASTYTSIYAVHYGEAHLSGWQYEPLQARDIGLLENGVAYRTFIDWAGGIFPAHNRSIARLYGIKLA